MMVVRYVSFLIECLPGRTEGSEMARKGDEKRGGAHRGRP